MGGLDETILTYQGTENVGVDIFVVVVTKELRRLADALPCIILLQEGQVISRGVEISKEAPQRIELRDELEITR